MTVFKDIYFAERKLKIAPLDFTERFGVFGVRTSMEDSDFCVRYGIRFLFYKQVEDVTVKELLSMPAFTSDVQQHRLALAKYLEGCYGELYECKLSVLSKLVNKTMKETAIMVLAYAPMFANEENIDFDADYEIINLWGAVLAKKNKDAV